MCPNRVQSAITVIIKRCPKKDKNLFKISMYSDGKEFPQIFQIYHMNVNNLSTLLMNKPDPKQTLEIAKKTKKMLSSSYQVPLL